MTFTTGLSGLSAAQNMLSVTGNNLANAQTAGFKQSRSEFEDVYATTVAGVASTTPGAGAKVGSVAQQFTQGNLNFTENSLDLAVSGEGFFVLGLNVNSPDARSYSRDGQFHLDANGNVVNNGGNVLMAYQPNDPNDVSAGFSTGLLEPLQITTSQSQPNPTSNVAAALNLDASLVANGDAGSTAVAWDPLNPTTTADYQTSVTVYDSLGSSHTLSTYYKKQAGGTNTWDVYYAIDYPTNAVSSMGTMQFDATGQLSTLTSTNANVTATASGFTIAAAGIPALTGGATLGTTANANSVTFDFAGSTQFGVPSSLNTLSQDGYASGNLIGVSTDEHGVVYARYSNGASTILGQVALARFQNPQGLTKLGDTRWAESSSSGSVVYGQAGVGDFGIMHAGALEASNVDMASQLVQLIIAQQMYQANTQTIQTQNTIMQSVLNI